MLLQLAATTTAICICESKPSTKNPANTPTPFYQVHHLRHSCLETVLRASLKFSCKIVFNQRCQAPAVPIYDVSTKSQRCLGCNSPSHFPSSELTMCHLSGGAIAHICQVTWGDPLAAITTCPHRPLPSSCSVCTSQKRSFLPTKSWLISWCPITLYQVTPLHIAACRHMCDVASA